MIEWLFYTSIDVTIIVVAVLLLRNPVRRFLGAHIAYWLWVLPLLRIIASTKFSRPEVITKHLKLPETNDLLPVYTQADQLSQTEIQIVLLVWLIGLIIWVTAKTFSWFQFNQYLANASSPYQRRGVRKTTSQIAKQSSVSMYQLDENKGPLITGLLNLKIYVPNNFRQKYSTNQQRLMLDHELTHARRLDLWAQLLLEIFRACFWFNPIIHIAFNKFREDQELACDYDMLKWADQATRADYGEALKKGLITQLVPQSLTFFHHKHERFLMLGKHQKSPWMTGVGLLFTGLVGYLFLTESAISAKERTLEQNGALVSYKFVEIPLSSIVMLVNQTSDQTNEIIGLELLHDTAITAQANKVHAYDFIDALLAEHRFEMTRLDRVWTIASTDADNN